MSECGAVARGSVTAEDGTLCTKAAGHAGVHGDDDSTFAATYPTCPSCGATGKSCKRPWWHDAPYGVQGWHAGRRKLLEAAPPAAGICNATSKSGVACQNEEPGHLVHYGQDGRAVRNWTTPAPASSRSRVTKGVPAEKPLAPAEARLRTSACPWCGGPVVQAATGRPRVFCEDAHKVAMFRWTRAWNAIQVGLDGVGRCYCCHRRGAVVEVGKSGGVAPFCEACAWTCDPDAGVMRPRPPKAKGSWYQGPSPCVTENYWHARPSGLGWRDRRAKPAPRRREK